VIHRLRRLTAALLLTALVAAFAGGGAVSQVPQRPDPATRPGPATGQLHVVALGDSVTSGTRCDCVAFPSMYGDLLHGRTGDSVSVDNLGAGGLDSTDLLNRLDQPRSPMTRATSTADVVLLTIGANDFGDHHDDITTGQCTDGDCVTDELGQLRTNLQRILAQIRSLRAGDPPVVLVTDYWNVFEDGEVARRNFPADGRAATTTLTRNANQVIASTAGADGAVFVDLYDAFEDSGKDVTSLLAPDGDHPNAAGHALIARLLLDATPELTAH
jgi:lysophospholipase L1-like esterase